MVRQGGEVQKEEDEANSHLKRSREVETEQTRQAGQTKQQQDSILGPGNLNPAIQKGIHRGASQRARERSHGQRNRVSVQKKTSSCAEGRKRTRKLVKTELAGRQGHSGG